MNLLNKAVYGSAFRRHGKRLRVLPVLEKGEVRARSLRRWERGTSGRWHIHCAIELPPHFDAFALETLIGDCWAKIELGYGRILVRDGANAGWINYMAARCEVGGGARQHSRFNNCGEGGSASTFFAALSVLQIFRSVVDDPVPRRARSAPPRF